MKSALFITALCILTVLALQGFAAGTVHTHSAPLLQAIEESIVSLEEGNACPPALLQASAAFADAAPLLSTVVNESVLHPILEDLSALRATAQIPGDRDTLALLYRLRHALQELEESQRLTLQSLF